MNNSIRPNFELIWAFMPVLVTCKFDKDPIKGDWAKLETSFFHCSRVRNSKMSGQIRPEFEFVWDFMPVLVTCKFIVTEKRWDTFFPIQSQWKHSRANNSVVKSPIQPKLKSPIQHKFELICKFDKDLIKGDWENVETAFFPLYVNGSFLWPW